MLPVNYSDLQDSQRPTAAVSSYIHFFMLSKRKLF